MSIPSLQHFLDIRSLEPEQFWGLLRLAKELKDERARFGRNAPILTDQIVGHAISEAESAHQGEL